MQSTRRDQRIVWMDLEMSGLDPARDRILEVACLITDSQLEIIAEGPELIVHQSDAVLDGMDDWNRQHHGQSGLTDRVRASTIDDAEAERATLEFVRTHVDGLTAPLAGNSIHQDRRFLQAYWTELEAYLHYRNIDVSTVKELTRRWYPDAFAAAPDKTGSHRALDDIRESIEELRYYRRSVFKA